MIPHVIPVEDFSCWHVGSNRIANNAIYGYMLRAATQPNPETNGRQQNTTHAN